jgi:hypothetical protein
VASVFVPPSYPGILMALESPEGVLSHRQGRFLAEWMREGADLVREMMDDAEITGSHDVLTRARRWLDQLGL